ncbi:hypothetical protein DJ021_02365 [Phenylobacterium hankyongense]|uniref:Uncharacterized protein n=1 Tax=Phenylobacterium hankyongense TaxID=1813876 RepID=A0A328AWV3_9CAUL|nr:hypothetical protein [Phenylobacterium hankyongense]RAK58725.1 hypothetical protein DJ021_02365 [Phenylobacterium hankyongense]
MMLARIRQALTSRTAGPLATTVAVVLAVLLAASMTSAWRTEEVLNARVAKLVGQLNDSGSYWRARAVSCEAVAGGQRGSGAIRVAAGKEGDDAAAARLAKEPPAGFDVCARMESADAAVLSTLK